MRSTLLFFIINLLILSYAHSQTDKVPIGLVFDDDAYNRTPHAPNFGGSKFDRVPLLVDLKKYAPTPRNQGYTGSCVGWACGYGALTISRAIQQNIEDRTTIDSIANSAFYIYNQITLDPKDCMSGAKITDAMKFLAQKGDCTISTFNGTCKSQPVQAAFEEAKQNKIKDYAVVFALGDEDKQKIIKTKKSLVNKMPVMIGMNITESFWLLQPKQAQWQPKDGEEILGGHALLVVGYNDIDQTFEVMNSWGTNWGNNGFGKISYLDFCKYVKYGFQLILPPDPASLSSSKELLDETGKFVFRYPNGYKKNNNELVLDEEGSPIIEFSAAKVFFDNERQLYYLEKNKWKVGDVFQLVVKNITAGRYVYIFSIDAKNKLEMHWPEMYSSSQQENEVYTDLPISDYVPNSFNEIIVPGSLDALQLQEVGTDHLIVFYSNRKVSNILEIAQEVRNKKGNMIDRLSNILSRDLISTQFIDYDNSTMSFDIKEGYIGHIVPVILSVDVN